MIDAHHTLGRKSDILARHSWRRRYSPYAAPQMGKLFGETISGRPMCFDTNFHCLNVETPVKGADNLSLVFRMLSFRSIRPLFVSSNGNILAILKMRRYSTAQPLTESARVHGLCSKFDDPCSDPAVQTVSNSYTVIRFRRIHGRILKKRMT